MQLTARSCLGSWITAGALASSTPLACADDPSSSRDSDDAGRSRDPNEIHTDTEAGAAPATDAAAASSSSEGGAAPATDAAAASSSSEGGAPPATDAAAAPPISDRLLAIEDLEYLGAFVIPSDPFGDSSADFAVGTLAYNPDNHSLFLAGHTHDNAIGEFAIPQLLRDDSASALQVARNLQGFRAPLDAAAEGNPEAIDRITGMLYVDGQLLVNAETWYDASSSNRDTTLVVRDATDLANSVVDGYFELDGAARAAGYLAPIPPEWRGPLGAEHLTGWSSVYSIVSRYSVGPSLFTFDVNDLLAPTSSPGPIRTTEWMSFPHEGQRYLDPDALRETEGSASPLWNFLTAAPFAFIVPGTRTFAAFGNAGGVFSGIGYKLERGDTEACPGFCAYDQDDYYAYYWFFDLDEILAAPNPWDVQPYAYGAWEVPFNDQGKHPIVGGTFDPEGNVIYLSLAAAGQLGEYDYPPLIVAFDVSVD